MPDIDARTCADCHRWERGTGEARDREHWGICEMTWANASGEVRNHADTLAVAEATHYGYGAWLTTHESFGCVQFE